jgi:hypothetical protein
LTDEQIEGLLEAWKKQLSFSLADVEKENRKVV